MRIVVETVAVRHRLDLRQKFERRSVLRQVGQKGFEIGAAVERFQHGNAQGDGIPIRVGAAGGLLGRLVDGRAQVRALDQTQQAARAAASRPRKPARRSGIRRPRADSPVGLRKPLPPRKRRGRDSRISCARH